MVLSEYWKSWRKHFFQNYIIFTVSSKFYRFKKIFPSAFFNILIKPLLVQTQIIPQQKRLILRFLELESLRVWHFQEGSKSTCHKKYWKKNPVVIIFEKKKHIKQALKVTSLGQTQVQVNGLKYQWKVLKVKILSCVRYFCVMWYSHNYHSLVRKTLLLIRKLYAYLKLNLWAQWHKIRCLELKRF